jgi:hypothetical protein
MEHGTKGPALEDRQLAYALEHPLRTRIVAELGKRPMEPAELAEALNEPLALVTYHHGVLEAVGLTGTGSAGNGP